MLCTPFMIIHMTDASTIFPQNLQYQQKLEAFRSEVFIIRTNFKVVIWFCLNHVYYSLLDCSLTRLLAFAWVMMENWMKFSRFGINQHWNNKWYICKHSRQCVNFGRMVIGKWKAAHFFIWPDVLLPPNFSTDVKLQTTNEAQTWPPDGFFHHSWLCNTTLPFHPKHFILLWDNF